MAAPINRHLQSRASEPSEIPTTTGGDGSWGWLEETAHVGNRTVDKDYREITFQDRNNSEFDGYLEAAHCMLFWKAKVDDLVFKVYRRKGGVLMQMRFDGYLGFPGGLVDPGEEPLESLNRELHEEINLDLTKFGVTQDLHICSHVCHKNRVVLHFYLKEIFEADLPSIERSALDAHDYGHEALGTIRVPLFTMGDKYRGFPAFLDQNFVGNSRTQLLLGLEKSGLLSADDLKKAVDSRKRD
ncbi:unnamed protein product [Cyprideis torosa]|uniref:U8 snoRNA-decapping enzyme n=1 Tax=Cyprideis torosa TaxID=163714 RepID=A0A7R8WIV9_9CRUS|nr:unnamed protein product [Cyprideis torosa]CAG0899316.1 unnamed protein product [Cyprideis torosa]